MAFFRGPKPLSKLDRKWLRFHLFESRNPRAYRDPTLRARYAETTALSKSYTKYLESLAAARRVEEIRLFHALTYDEKRRHILALKDLGQN